MNPFFSVFLHAIGGFSSASFYVPISKVRQWAWETYWVTLGFVAWVVMPQVGGLLTTCDLWGILRHSPGSSMAWSYLFGVLWGFGGFLIRGQHTHFALRLGVQNSRRPASAVNAPTAPVGRSI